MYIKDSPKLQKLLKECQLTEFGRWLRCFDWSAIRLFKIPFKKQGLFTACYIAPLNCILAAPDEDGRVFFSTICHQLYHAYQKRVNGIFKYLILKTFRRNKLQLPAQAAQLSAAQWACQQPRQEFDI